MEFNNATFRGEVHAASGTFAGELVAATGSFEGTLTLQIGRNADLEFEDSSGTSRGSLGVRFDGSDYYTLLQGNAAGYGIRQYAGKTAITGDFSHNSGAGGSGVGFFGVTPVSRPTVTGSKGGNAALGSLVSALASLGLIVDSTT
jgi:hypothetical protein